VWRHTDCGGAGGCLGRDQNRSDKSVVARLVEILQVKSIIPNLVEGRGTEVFLINLELQNKNHWPNYQDDVYALTHPWD